MLVDLQAYTCLLDFAVLLLFCGFEIQIFGPGSSEELDNPIALGADSQHQIFPLKPWYFAGSVSF